MTTARSLFTADVRGHWHRFGRFDPTRSQCPTAAGAGKAPGENPARGTPLPTARVVGHLVGSIPTASLPHRVVPNVMSSIPSPAQHRAAQWIRVIQFAHRYMSERKFEILVEGAVSIGLVALAFYALSLGQSLVAAIATAGVSVINTFKIRDFVRAYHAEQSRARDELRQDYQDHQE